MLDMTATISVLPCPPVRDFEHEGRTRLVGYKRCLLITYLWAEMILRPRFHWALSGKFKNDFPVRDSIPRSTGKRISRSAVSSGHLYRGIPLPLESP
eukprot:561520-Pelagomonas_calceolata.AAC.1